MRRPKRLYPLGRYRLRVPKDAETDKAYPVTLSYWNIPETGKLSVKRQMFLQRLPTETRTGIKDVASCVSVTAANTSVSTSFCRPVSNGSTASSDFRRKLQTQVDWGGVRALQSIRRNRGFE